MSLTILCQDLLKRILAAVIGQNTYSIAWLTINKHIYSVANEVWFAMVRDRLVCTGAVNMQEMEAAVCNTTTANHSYEVLLYANDSLLTPSLELKLRFTFPCAGMFVYRDVPGRSIQIGPSGVKFRHIITLCFTRVMDGLGMVKFIIDNRSRMDHNPRDRHKAISMMCRILPEITHLFIQ